MMLWSLIFLVCWWILLLLPVKKYSFWMRSIYYTTLTALLLYAGIATLGVYYEMLYPPCLITQETLVHIGPDMSYAVRGTLASGTQVRVLQQDGMWCKVQHDNLVGWITTEKSNP